ncbi:MULTISPECIES: glycine cleavage system protein GcvH [Chitinilyticum]|uniref:Glycine cleavage system H protein n=1 Tax=Chitinilyticum piscinae TaxID=2866724 RepID=A0A8J7K2P7_9NEIS|nr:MULTISPECIES: glycine cleavage system protein GcvH [Chitinilyticum]MBE9610781.1 glycine cleavage system protein GcvH [Chitinilyticum piscinae]
MSKAPAELKYVETHEWLRLEADGSVTIGITDHAQELLGDVVYVELPAVGSVLAKDAQAGVVESVKAASDVYAPIAGEVVAINDELVGAPETVNADPYGAAWFFRIKPADASVLDGLMSADDYLGQIGA